MQALIAAIQAIGGREASVKVLRAGKEITLKLTPELRKNAANLSTRSRDAQAVYTWIQPQTVPLNANHVFLYESQLANALNSQGQPAPRTASQGPVEKRLQEVMDELKALRGELSELKKALNKQ